MIRKYFVLFLIFLNVSAPSFANVLTVDQVSVIGAAADDYYTGSKTKLKVLDGNKIGRTLVTSAELSATASLSGLAAGAAGIAGIAYYERTGEDPVYAVANAVASASDALFVPAYQAFKANFVSPESYPDSAVQFIGVDGGVGISMGDLVNVVKKSANESYVALKQLINDHTSQEYPTITIFDNQKPAGGLILDSASGVNYLQPGGGSWVEYSGGLADQQWDYFLQIIGDSPIYQATISGYPAFFALNDSSKQIFLYHIGAYINAPAYRQIHVYNFACTPTEDPETAPAVEPAVDYAALKNDFLAPSAAISNEVKDVIKEAPREQIMTTPNPAPSVVPAPAPSPITNNQIQNFFTENTTNVYNEYLDTVTNNVTNQGDVINEVAHAAAETAKAQEEEANKGTEDTYSSITSNSFGESYNPGEFDIPTRFTTFLNNVKSSGLFSFSSDFFESLPGGGTSTYTVDAGIYGSHTIDLSDTMSGGLAVLKTILLACFGFLSIRAVIMKR